MDGGSTGVSTSLNFLPWGRRHQVWGRSVPPTECFQSSCSIFPSDLTIKKMASQQCGRKSKSIRAVQTLGIHHIWIPRGIPSPSSGMVFETLHLLKILRNLLCQSCSSLSWIGFSFLFHSDYLCYGITSVCREGRFASDLYIFFSTGKLTLIRFLSKNHLGGRCGNLNPVGYLSPTMCSSRTLCLVKDMNAILSFRCFCGNWKCYWYVLYLLSTADSFIQGLEEG